jgi:type I restriction enzyme, S subunit
LFETKHTGSATPHLFQKDIRKFKLSIPPIEEQVEIVNQIESRMINVDMLEGLINEAIIKSETLRQSILKSAFEGRLV